MSSTIQPDHLAKNLLASREFFERSARVLGEADSAFRPQPEMMTAAQQVAHVAMTIDWFLEGASRPEGFDLDFEKHVKLLQDVKSLTAARQQLAAAYENALRFVRSLSAEQLALPLPPGPVMGGEPVSDVFGAMIEHTAHHRGALTVYSRLLGKTPLMPYGE